MHTFIAVVILFVLLMLALIVALWINKRKTFTYTGRIPTKPVVSYTVTNVVPSIPVGFAAPAPEQFTAPPLPGRNYIGVPQQ